MSQICTSENADWFARSMLITCPGLCFQCELMAKYENYGLPGRSVPPQVDSDKLRVNCIAKQKCTDESQKLDTRRRGENLNGTSHVSRTSLATSLASAPNPKKNYIQ